MNSYLALRLFGTPQVTFGGQVVRGFESRKALALLCYLSVRAQPISRTLLADLFWGDKPEGQGRANLSRVLHNLNTLLPETMAATRDAIGVVPGAFRLDTEEFESLVQQGTPDALAAAAALYSDEFMMGIFLDDCPEVELWLVAERERWRQRAVDVLERLVQHYAAQSEYQRALPFGARILDLEPWREEAHRQLMDLLAHTGLRNAALQQYETARRVLAEELGVEPSPETTALYEQIRAQSPALPSLAAPKSNLPVQLTLFVGRETELARIAARLSNPDCRLLTLTGAGGIGKTRLAIEAARNMTDAFPDGVYFVPLAAHGVGQTELIIPTIANVFGLTQLDLDPKAQLLRYLQDKRILLILDNFEHLLGGADLALELVQGAPQLKLLVTSREPLNVQAEWVTQVQGLSYPTAPLAAGQDVLRYSAVRLFVERASRADEAFALDEVATLPVLRICRTVEGMPLAIELAAAASKTLPIGTIAERIAEGPDELATAARDVETRHSSLRAVLDWSYGLLSEQERSLFRRLAVFAGGWTLAAAETICAGDGLDGKQIASLISRLVDKSLVLRQQTSVQERYRMLEPVRQYALQLFSETPEVSMVRTRHMEYFAALEEVAAPNREATGKVTWRSYLEPDLSNLRAALAWAQAEGGADLVLQAALERRIGDALKRRGEIRQALDYYFSALEALGKPFPTKRGRLRQGIFKEFIQQIGHRLLPAYFLRSNPKPANLVVDEEYRTIEEVSDGLAWSDSEGTLLASLRLLNISEKNQFSNGMVRGYIMSGITLDVLTLYNFAENYYTLASSLADTTRNPFAIGLANYGVAYHQVVTGHLDVALEHGIRAASGSQAAGDLRGWAVAALLVAQTLVYLGDLKNAPSPGVELVQLGQDEHSSELERLGEMMQGMAQRRIGNLGNAQIHLERAIKLAELVPDPYVGVLASGELAQCYLGQGELARAREILGQGTKLRSEYTSGTNALTHLAFGQATMYLVEAEGTSGGQRAELVRMANDVCRGELKRRNAFHPGIPETMLLLGRCEWLRGNPEAAQKWWTRSLAEAERMKMRYDAAMTHLEMGKRLGKPEHVEMAKWTLNEIGAEWKQG